MKSIGQANQILYLLRTLVFPAAYCYDICQDASMILYKSETDQRNFGGKKCQIKLEFVSSQM